MADNNKNKKTSNKKSPAKKAPAKKAAPKKAPAAKAVEPKISDAAASFVKAEEFVNAVLDNVSETASTVNLKIDKTVKEQKRSIRRFFKKLFK